MLSAAADAALGPVTDFIVHPDAKTLRYTFFVEPTKATRLDAAALQAQLGLENPRHALYVEKGSMKEPKLVALAPGTFAALARRSTSSSQYKPKKICDDKLAEWLLGCAATPEEAPELRTPETRTPEPSEPGSRTPEPSEGEAVASEVTSVEAVTLVVDSPVQPFEKLVEGTVIHGEAEPVGRESEVVSNSCSVECKETATLEQRDVGPACQ